MADDKSTSSTGAPADSPEFQFPRFFLQRNDKLCSSDPFFGDLPGLRRSSGWEWDPSTLRGNRDGEVPAGAEFAAHYVKLLKDGRDAPVGNVLGRDLVPILAEAPRGVQIGFFSTIERLLIDHAPEPFETIKAYEREDSESLNAEHEPTEANGVEEQKGLDSVEALAALAAIGRHSQSAELESDIKKLVAKHNQADPAESVPSRLMKGAGA